MVTIKAFTDLEQSKKLAEILPLESADMHYKVNRYNNESKIFMMPYSVLGFYKDNVYHYCVPCWSVGVLLSLLPNEISNGERYCDKYQFDIRKYDRGENITFYQICYGNDRGNSGSWHDMINTGEKENLIDAAFDMICWLKENGKL